MHQHRRHAVVAIAAAALLLAPTLTACNPPSDEPTPTPTTTSATTTPTATATALTPEEQAVEDAEKAVTAYYEMTDALFADPMRPIDDVNAVATGQELDLLQRMIQRQRAQGQVQVGKVAVNDFRSESVDLTADPPTVRARVCLDVSGANVVDASGASVVTPGRVPQTTIGLVLVQQSDKVWRVDSTDSKGEPCGA